MVTKPNVSSTRVWLVFRSSIHSVSIKSGAISFEFDKSTKSAIFLLYACQTYFFNNKKKTASYFNYYTYGLVQCIRIKHWGTILSTNSSYHKNTIYGVIWWTRPKIHYWWRLRVLDSLLLEKKNNSQVQLMKKMCISLFLCSRRQWRDITEHITGIFSAPIVRYDLDEQLFRPDDATCHTVGETTILLAGSFSNRYFQDSWRLVGISDLTSQTSLTYFLGLS